MRKGIKRRKLLLRLFSLLFGFFIWMYVISTAEIEVQKYIPLEIEPPEDFSVATDYKNEITLKIKGPRVFVRSFLDKKEIYRISDKKFFASGQKTYKLNINQFKFALPFGVKLIDYNPKTISFSIDKTIKKTVPLKFNVDPKITNSFDLKQLSSSPNKVEISGAKSLVNSITQIETKMISDKKLLEGNTVNIDLIYPSPRIIMNHNYAVVSYKLDSLVQEFTFTQIPIIFQSEKLITAAAPKKVSVKVRAPKGELNLDLKSKISVLAKVGNSDEKKIDVQLQAQLPDQVELIAIEPKVVSIVTE